ncbi:hypothetical protein E4T56_gene10688 [Termitomyces sp. T112]|nr:hypothetical protein E4T56_gene10688 [Termitomyces sp. T112]
MSSVCVPHHDWFTALLTFGLCCGLIVSYLPQHLRIINQGSSEGLSPWFLLLGSTSSAAGFLNMITMQWRIVRCCPAFNLGTCVEMTAGIVQLGLQWAMFTIILVLYIIYYPPHLKYIRFAAGTHHTRQPIHVKTPIKSPEWRLSIILAWVVAIHMAIITFTSFLFLLTVPTSPVPDAPLPEILAKWATFLGVSSALLATVQYAPQLIHTYRAKIVGALSIPMMCIQSPGAVLMVLSIALRPGTNWTSWIMFAVSGIMQGSLLAMCIVFHFRQRRLGLDEFGNPLPSRTTVHVDTPASEATVVERGDGGVDVPGLVTTEEEDPRVVGVALVRALESATGSDIRAVAGVPSEETPLLGRSKEGKGWLSWLRRT